MKTNFLTRIFTVVIVTLIGISNNARSEGVLTDVNAFDPNGLYGANRRVRTQPYGYDAVFGTFTVPTIVVPIPNERHSKPSFYLGGGHTADGIHTDAGVQYEWATGSYMDASGTHYVAPGWSIFFRVSGGPNPDYVNPSSGWRAGVGTHNPNVTSFTMTYVVTPQNIANLFVDANGAVGQPGALAASGGAAVFNNTNGLFVKRVVAITQGGQGSSRLRGGNYDEDGSFMRGCVFSGGHVTTNVTTTGGTINFGSWDDWSNASIDQAGTGYYPSGRDKAWPNLNYHTKGHLPRVDFPDTARDAVDATRYDAETVDINLRRHQRVRGRLVRPRRPNQPVNN